MSMQRVLLPITALAFAVALAFFIVQRLGDTATCVVLGAVAGVVLALPLAVVLGVVFAGMMYRRPPQQPNQPSPPVVVMPPVPDVETDAFSREAPFARGPRFARPHGRATFASGARGNGFRIAGED